MKLWVLSHQNGPKYLYHTSWFGRWKCINNVSDAIFVAIISQLYWLYSDQTAIDILLYLQHTVDLLTLFRNSSSSADVTSVMKISITSGFAAESLSSSKNSLTHISLGNVFKKFTTMFLKILCQSCSTDEGHFNSNKNRHTCKKSTFAVIQYLWASCSAWPCILIGLAENNMAAPFNVLVLTWQYDHLGTNTILYKYIRLQSLPQFAAVMCNAVDPQLSESHWSPAQPLNHQVFV